MIVSQKYSVASKIVNGKIVTVWGSTRPSFLTNSKKYWIEYGSDETCNGRRAINRSNNLSYIMKQFKKIA